jgi:hypothetical protein
MKPIAKYTLGHGDRFGRQGVAQLQAVMDARAEGFAVCPVWNKSMREHTLVGSKPQSTRDEADAAVQQLGYTGSYYVDADHINMETVDAFLPCSDFFTLDVAGKLGRPPASAETVMRYHAALAALGEVRIHPAASPLIYDEAVAAELIQAYGGAVEAAGMLYKKILLARPDGLFVVEVSMDETDAAQGAKELLAILCLLALEDVPVQTIAPKFTGRFNKGVDYVGDIGAFRDEFEADLLAVRYAVDRFGLPETLKLSIHSGSDKFNLYPVIRALIEKYDAGVHLKTAGTTWLEEVAGLAEAGGAALAFVQQLYVDALGHYEELVAPYATVLDINRAQLPSAAQSRSWTSEQLVAMVAHEPDAPLFNADLRQFFHVAYKLAAQAGETYFQLLERHAAIINLRVRDNLFNKHIRHIFPAKTEETA